MKIQLFKLLVLVFPLLLFSQNRTVVSSEIRWKAFKTLKTDALSHYGTIKLKSGNVIFKNNELVGGSFIIDMKDIDAEDMKSDKKMKLMLENHLRSDDFFDVAKYPISTFKITSTKKNNNKTFTYIVAGDLTIKGVTKKISFPVSVIKIGDNVKITSAKFSFNRKNFGLKYNIFEDMIISNDVDMNIILVVR